MSTQVIVVGGGLAGLSAAHTVIERGGNVVVLEKNPFLGGNSTKATSGMNGALTKTQIKLGIPDSVDIFYEDSARSARDLIVPELTKVLTYNSASAVEWVNEKFGVDLSLVSRLGGHSQPRTHRGKEKFPGMTITYALMEKLEDLAISHPKNVRIIKKAKVTRLLQDAAGKEVIGCEYEHDGKLFSEYGPVVLATGGYAADFTADSLLKKYRPDIYDLPTTNGDHSTGDGIKMALALGANTIHMEKVQVHPTGLVDPQEPDAKVKFLAAEALRGVGGILLNKEGKRFCDELGHRDYVTGEIWKTPGPHRLVLNGAAGREIEWHVKHYRGRGLMKSYSSGAELAKDMGISPKTLEETFNAYNEVAASKKDPYGKKFFHNVPFKMDDEFWVAHITPVLHFTMGGLQIDDQCDVISSAGATIPGLFACGELGGGVHGANRLGGSSLLGCVVFGRVAGDTASRYLFSRLSSSQVATARVGQVANQLGGMKLNVVPSANGLQLEITWGGDAISVPAPLPAAAPAPAAA
ncbi:fumarate reductase, partial [Hyaloraphidium curvatum]